MRLCMSEINLRSNQIIKMTEVIKAMKASNVKSRTVIGGAPITQSFADEIGADAYAADAVSAVDVTKKLLTAS